MILHSSSLAGGKLPVTSPNDEQLVIQVVPCRALNPFDGRDHSHIYAATIVLLARLVFHRGPRILNRRPRSTDFHKTR